MLLKSYNSEINDYEIGVDEVGRGPMFGRVYVAAVILPPDESFKHELMKDSKKFTSKRKIEECSKYIKENAIAYSIQYLNSDIIDKINIREATLQCMHNAITEVIKTINTKEKVMLLIDGNDFKPYMYFEDTYKCIPNINIKGGDNIYSSIAAASILAKVARDNYIEELCEKHDILNEYYDILSNKGYGTKNHMEGIKKYGITNLHRKCYGICKTTPINYYI